MKEYDDEEWHVFEFVPDLIVVHCGIQGGSPTVKGTRVPTWTASGSYERNEYKAYHIKKGQAFASFCFEAGREYEKKHIKINKVVNDNWDKYNHKHFPELFKSEVIHE